MAEKNALVKVNDREYAVLVSGTEAVQEIIATNLAGSSISAFDLDRVTIPAGGGTNWSVPTLDGEKSEPVIEGVIVFQKNGRVFWEKGMDEGGGSTPPDCSSDNGVRGDLGVCADCPQAKWGSAKKGKGQACRSIKQLFIITPDSFVPVLISLPPTSLGVASKYMLRLAGKCRPFYSVSTKFELETTKNEAGIKYSKVKLSVGAMLTPEQTAKFKGVADALRPVLEHTAVTEKDYAVPPEDDSVLDED